MSNNSDMYRVMIESNNLGVLFCRQGRYQMAAMFLLQALRIAESINGKLSKDYCDALYNLGNTFADAGNYDYAVKYLIAAEQNAILRHAVADMDMVHLLNSIAYAKEAQEDLPAAIEYLEAAHNKLRRLAANESRLRSDDLPRNAFYLAGVCENAGELNKALCYYNETLALLEELNTQYYPTCLNNTANVLTSLGDHDAAISLRLKALEQIKAVVGPRSIYYAQCVKSMASVYQKRGNHEHAKTLLREAIDIKRELLGINSVETIREIMSLIELHALANETDKALEIFMLLLNEMGDNFEGHDDILKEMANLFMSFGDFNRFNELYNQAAELRTDIRDNEEQ